MVTNISNGTIWGRVANTLQKTDTNVTEAEIAAATNKIMKANEITATEARSMTQADINGLRLNTILPPAPAPAAAIAKPPEQTADIFVIDEFTADPRQKSPTDPTKGFNHGQTVSNLIQSGGVIPGAASNIAVHNIDISNPNVDRSQQIADALSKIAAQAKANPASVDAVNISQAASGSNAGTRLIQQKVQELEALGVPVLIAAGNNGPNTPNTIAPEGAIVVQSSDRRGNTLNDSGPGTVKVNAPDATQPGLNRQTSFATPEIAPLVAQMKMMGGSINDIEMMLSYIQAFQGGTIKGAPVKNAFT